MASDGLCVLLSGQLREEAERSGVRAELRELHAALGAAHLALGTTLGTAAHEPEAYPGVTRQGGLSAAGGAAEAAAAAATEAVAATPAAAEAASVTAPDTHDGASTLTEVVAGTFATPVELATWLENKGIDTASWGTASAKTVADLHVEIEQGGRWLPMASDGFRWLPMTSDGFRWLPMASDGLRWVLVASDGLIWLHMASDAF